MFAFQRARIVPDVLILSESPDNQEPNEAFKNSPAVKNGRVYKVSADLLSRPGPRHAAHARDAQASGSASTVR